MELPANLIGNVVERGQILHSDIFSGIDHPKFFVIIGVSDEEVAGFFYINSRINMSVNKKQEQLDMQYPLYTTDYAFLDHNSFICATNVLTINKRQIVQSILDKHTKVIGSMKSEHINELLCKLRESRLFSNYIKRKYFY